MKMDAALTTQGSISAIGRMKGERFQLFELHLGFRKRGTAELPAMPPKSACVGVIKRVRPLG
jgi:hypothetical protein